MLPKTKLYRFLEVIPGVLIWGTLVGAILLSFVRPLWAIIFIILFDLYWLFRVVYFVFYLSLSWRHFENDGKANWWKKLQTDLPEWQQLWQIVFLPTYKEELTVLRTTLTALNNSYFPKERLVVVLAGEEREGEAFVEKVEQLKKEFGEFFPHLLVTIHPQGLPDEIPGKGSNLHFSGKLVKEYIDRLQIPYADILVSAFDVDTAVHPQYFAYLAYRYLTTPDREHASYQPIALYNNNIWESPALVRLAAWGTTFWLMTELPRSERLFTFSSHSMPWQALVDVGFWQKDIVTEDSRIFLQCFLHYGGNYRVVPLYLPVSMDTVTTGSYVGSLKALYFQQRRWAWGIEHFPYMAWHFLKARAIPVRKKIKFMWNLGEGMYSWATAPILIFLLGQLPFFVGESTLGNTVFFQATPPVLKFIMRAAMIGMIISAVLTFRLLPPVPPGIPRHRRFHILWQWLLLPVSLIVFGSLPAFDAQTRLMFGKYLGFNVTEKVRAKPEAKLIQKEAQI